MVEEVKAWLGTEFPGVSLAATPVADATEGFLSYGGAAILLDSRDGDADTRSSGWKMAHQYDIIPGSAVAAALQATDGRRLLVVSYYAKCGRGNVDVGCRARQMEHINARVAQIKAEWGEDVIVMGDYNLLIGERDRSPDYRAPPQVPADIWRLLRHVQLAGTRARLACAAPHRHGCTGRHEMELSSWE
jgi:hypothetical protein